MEVSRQNRTYEGNRGTEDHPFREVSPGRRTRPWQSLDRRIIKATIGCGQKRSRSKVVFLVLVCLRNMHKTLTLGSFLYHLEFQPPRDILGEDGVSGFGHKRRRCPQQTCHRARWRPGLGTERPRPAARTAWPRPSHSPMVMAGTPLGAGRTPYRWPPSGYYPV